MKQGVRLSNLPLHLKNAEFVKILAEKGMQDFPEITYYYHAILLALEDQSEPSIANLLVEAGVPSADKANHVDALQVAMEHGRMDIAKLLIIGGTPTNVICNSIHKTTLHAAIFHNSLEIVGLLLTREPNLTASNHDNQLAIEYAASLSHWGIVEKIAQFKKTDAKDEAHYGQALAYAARDNKTGMCENLLKAGAPANALIGIRNSKVVTNCLVHYFVLFYIRMTKWWRYYCNIYFDFKQQNEGKLTALKFAYGPRSVAYS